MTAKPVRVCPACRGVARCKPLPPEGFWQVQILQRIGMYPYRCEGCGARFYRRTTTSEALNTPPRARTGEKSDDESGAQNLPPVSHHSPRVVSPPEVEDEGLSHADFVDLIGHISRSEQRKGLKAKKGSTEDE